MADSSTTRYALVSGGAGGIGRAIALRLARDGWRVAVADLDTDGAEETLAQITSAGGAGRVEMLDVRDADAWRALRERLESQWPRLHLLVNGAGVCAGGEVGDYPLDDWRWVIDINLHGVFHGCHAMLPWLKANSRGAHIINIASIAAFLGAPAMSAYNVSKAGVVALSETLRAELVPQGIGVTVVCPGFVRTPLLDRGRFSNQMVLDLARDHMRRAQITPDDVAEATVRAVGTRQLYVVLGRRARFLWRLKRFFPAALRRLLVLPRPPDQPKP
jgi:NAD(P)-dependent dehydrogenase (short-subunit alcohol dehydrogenase family)